MYGSNRGRGRGGNHRGTGRRTDRHYNDRQPPKPSNPFLAAGSKSWEEIQAENKAQLNSSSTSNGSTNNNANTKQYNNPYLDNKLLQSASSQFNPIANNQFINEHSPNTNHSTNNTSYTHSPSDNHANSQYGRKHSPSKSKTNPFLGAGSKSWAEIQAENEEEVSSTSTSHEIKDNDPPKTDPMESTQNHSATVPPTQPKTAIDFEAMVADIEQRWNIQVEEKKEKKRLERIEKEKEKLQYKQQLILQQQSHGTKHGVFCPPSNNPHFLPCINEDQYTQNHDHFIEEIFYDGQEIFYDEEEEDDDLQMEMESESNSAQPKDGHFMASPAVKDFDGQKGQRITTETVHSLKPNDLVYRQAENKEEGWESWTVQSVDAQDGVLTLHRDKPTGIERLAVFPEQLEDEILVQAQMDDEWIGSNGKVNIGDIVKINGGDLYKTLAVQNYQCRLMKLKDKTEVVLDLSAIKYSIL